MDAGKVKMVLNALRDELGARRAAAAQGTAGSADDAAVLPASAVTGAHLNREDRNAQSQPRGARRMPANDESGVLVHLSGDAPAASDSHATLGSPKVSAGEQLGNRPISEVVVPFRISDEPLVPVAPYLAIAVIAAAAVLGLVVLVF
jgi:hypothetical protein